MKSSSNFINPHFDLIRLSIQENIGKFVVALLILTYLATGFIIGIALQKGLTPFGPVISWIAGMGLAVIGQMIRGSLVYFGQANPYRLGNNAHWMGTAAALALTIYACYEVISLLSEQGISQAVQVSAVGFIIAGFFVEVFFLKELVKINQSILVNSPALYEQALNNERRLAEIKIKMTEASIALMHARRQRMGQALNNTEPQEAPPTLPDGQPPQALPEPEESKNSSRVLSGKVLNTVGEAYNLDNEQMDIFRQAVDEGLNDESLIRLIEGFSAKNRMEDKRKKNGIITDIKDFDLAQLFGNKGNGTGLGK
ncbi:MAG: hypothetical protein KDD01_13605 [Phaeodactylibacter sp.]|nr:hypothetical protein [Phaeodactylibacter sp.]